MIIKILYALVFLSFLPANLLSFNTGFFQLSPFRVLVLLLPILVIIDNFYRERARSIIPRGANAYAVKFHIFWFVYAFFTVIWAKSNTAWFRSVYFLGLGLLCVVIINMYFHNIENIKNAFLLLTLMTLVNTVLGWYEFLTQNYLFLEADRAFRYGLSKYPVSWFYNTNDFATFLLIGIFASYISLKLSKQKVVKILSLLIIIGAIPLVFLTRSRANIVGLVISIVLFYFIMLKRKRRSLLSLYIILLITGLLVVGFVTSNIYESIFGGASFDFEGSGSDSTRLNLLKNGGYFFLRTFGFGVGSGNIEYWMERYAMYPTGGITNIHNWWGEILTAYGLVVFIGYLSLYWKLFSTCYQLSVSKTENKEVSVIATFIACSLAGFVIGAVSSSSNISSEWLWVYMAVVIAFVGVTKNLESTNHRSVANNRIIQ
ncbi:MAG: O-antigen ligase family protein [Clostridia bacterium]